MAMIKERQKDFGGVVGGFPPATSAGTLLCERCGRFRRFEFKELRIIKNCFDVLAEMFACNECQWTRQWGARSG